jgi:septal ring factor EnvC (AmiA/AmiB activator)
MHRWLSIGVILLAGAALAAKPQEELKTVQQDLAGSKKQAEQLADKLEENQKTLETLSARAAALAAALQAAESRVDKAEGSTAQAERERDAKQAEFDARKAQFTQTLSSLVTLHRLPPTAMLADKQHLETMLKTASALEKTNEALAIRTAELKESMEQLATVKKKAGDQRRTLDKERQQLTKEQQALKQELAKRQQAQAGLLRDKEKAEARVAELSKQSKSLQELITRLERQPVLGPARETRRMASAGSARGRFKLPVTGTLLHGFGEKKNENETYRGMLLGGRSGGAVVAPFEGEVVFTGPFRDYGRMVLIKHGGGFISLLAGLGDIDVALNQRVTAGEPVGSMPATPTPKLYVELRKESKPVDPADWFANLPQKRD